MFMLLFHLFVCLLMPAQDCHSDHGRWCFENHHFVFVNISFYYSGERDRCNTFEILID